MRREESRRAVDAALGEASRGAADTRLPPALRARILAATRSAAAPPPRGRLVDFVLRAAAIAAAVAAVAIVVPTPLEAAEFDATPLAEWNARLGETVTEHLAVTQTLVPDLPMDTTWPLALVAAAMVGAGLALARRGRSA